MSVKLEKGQKISLEKNGGGELTKVTIGLGWDAAVASKGLFGSKGHNIDCDASAFVLHNGKLASREDIVYFGHLEHRSGAVKHHGDNLTGDGDGDDEQITVKLNALPASCDKVVFVVNIYQAKSRKQHFGMIKNAYIRIMDDNGTEMCKYNLSGDYNGKTAMIFGEVYKHNGAWKFNAIGQGTNDLSVQELAHRYE